MTNFKQKDKILVNKEQMEYGHEYVHLEHLKSTEDCIKK